MYFQIKANTSHSELLCVLCCYSFILAILLMIKKLIIILNRYLKADWLTICGVEKCIFRNCILNNFIMFFLHLYPMGYRL